MSASSNPTLWFLIQNEDINKPDVTDRTVLAQQLSLGNSGNLSQRTCYRRVMTFFNLLITQCKRASQRGEVSYFYAVFTKRQSRISLYTGPFCEVVMLKILHRHNKQSISEASHNTSGMSYSFSCITFSHVVF
jgi:hypothetical protein